MTVKLINPHLELRGSVRRLLFTAVIEDNIFLHCVLRHGEIHPPKYRYAKAFKYEPTFGVTPELAAQIHKAIKEADWYERFKLPELTSQMLATKPLVDGKTEIEFNLPPRLRPEQLKID